MYWQARLLGAAILIALPADGCKPGCTCTDERFDCMEQSLVEVPPVSSYGSTFHTVTLSRNQIEGVPHDAFPGLPDLQVIQLNHNHIVHIEAGAFNNLDKLLVLNLDSNRLTEIQPTYFQGLPSLDALYLANNHISTMDYSDLFDLVPSLETLDLSANIATATFSPSLLANLPKLRVFVMNDLPLMTQLPSSLFESNGALEEVSMLNNSLSDIPTVTLSSIRSSLHRFQFGRNKLVRSIATETFSDFANLSSVDLISLTELESVAERAFSNLPKLNNVHLMENSRLSSIHPNAFRTLNPDPVRYHIFNVFSLRDNALRTLDENMLPWENIKRLDFRGNPWACYCGLKWMAGLSNVPDNHKTDFRCSSPPRCRGMAVWSMKATDFYCPAHGEHSRRVVGVLVAVVVAIAIVTVCAVAIWRLKFCQRMKKKYYKPMYVSIYNMEVKRGQTRELITEMQDVRPSPPHHNPRDAF